jgi:hypothetical protein
MLTAGTLEAEWRQVLQGSMSMGVKEDESNTGQVWAAGFHHVTARSHLAGILKLINRLFLQFSNFFQTVVNRGKLKPQILNQRIRGHTCVLIFTEMQTDNCCPVVPPVISK